MEAEFHMEKRTGTETHLYCFAGHLLLYRTNYLFQIIVLCHWGAQFLFNGIIYKN